MAFFHRSSDFDHVTSSESDRGETDEEVPIQSYSPVAFRNILRVRSSHHLLQDTEENVQLQTEDVFINYIYQTYHLGSSRGESCDMPAPHDLLNLSRNPLTPAAEVGRRLASLGDNLAERYSDELDGMVSSLCNDDAYEAFAGIARSVFSGGIKWSRILILLNFGYRLAIAKLQNTPSGFSDFLSRIVSFMIKFIVTEKIARWIAQHGGWVAAITSLPVTSSSAFYVISGLAALTVLAVVFSHKYL